MIRKNKQKNRLIQLKQLTKIYTEGHTKNFVLNQVNETIYKDELIILHGRSGSGKSTLLNLVSGIDLPTSGEVIIEDNNITRFTEQQRTLFRRKNIGFIFQFFNLIQTLTVEENLMLPLELNERVSKKDINQIEMLLTEVGLDGRANSYPDRLSGGDQQRVAIARALIHNPPIILADEPTGNLDFETGIQIINLLDRLVRNSGKTMIMATHSKEVMGLADRILTVKEGKLTTNSLK